MTILNQVLEYGASPYTEEQEPIGWILYNITDGTWKEKYDCVKKIIDSEAFVDYYDAEGCVALTGIAGTLATEDNSYKYSEEKAKSIKQLYIYAKEKCNKESDKDGTTVLHSATAYGRNLVLVNYLVEECEYSLNVQNIDGETPLIYMLKYYNPKYDSDCNMKEITEYYISQGADLMITDTEGKTAYNYAVEKGKVDIAELIKFNLG